MTHRMRSHSYTLSLTLSSFSHIPSKSRLQTRTPSIPTSPNHETASEPQVRLKPLHQKTRRFDNTASPYLKTSPLFQRFVSLPTPNSQLPTPNYSQISSQISRCISQAPCRDPPPQTFPKWQRLCKFSSRMCPARVSLLHGFLRSYANRLLSNSLDRPPRSLHKKPHNPALCANNSS